MITDREASNKRGPSANTIPTRRKPAVVNPNNERSSSFRGRLLVAIAACTVAISVVALGSAGASVPATTKPPPPFTNLEKSLRAEEHLTFKVTYSTHGSGTSQTLVFEQKPPNARFGTSQGFVLELNGKAYYCTTAAGHAVCIKTSANPLAGFVGLFSPAAVVTDLKLYQSEYLAKIKGVTVSSAHKTFAGQASTCIIVTVKSKTYEICVTNSHGILAYSGTSTNYIQLTAYSSSPPAGDFALPRGATITSG